MRVSHPIPEALAEAASFLTPQEQEQLWRAAIIMADSRGVIQRFSAMFGRRVEHWRGRAAKAAERFGGEAWTELAGRTQDAIEDTLWSAYHFAAAGLDIVPPIVRPHGAKNNRMHRLATAASGAASGFVGLPGILFDIPFTTMTILRSIAQVARDHGEDLSDEDTKRACLEVLAYGGPGPADDDTEAGYWVTRIGVNHIAINMLIRTAAGRFGLVLSDKFLAQAVPVIGAVAGSALNYAFTEHYQNMAQVQFSLRAVARRSGDPAGVRRCFAEMVRAARERRRISRRSRADLPVAYLPREA